MPEGYFYAELDRQLFGWREFTENAWDTDVYKYPGHNLNTFDPVRNNVYMLLRAAQPYPKQNMLIGSVHIDDSVAQSSAFLDSTYNTYSFLQAIY
jgi:hypothetical protein